jgi:hypothetical protein
LARLKYQAIAEFFKTDRGQLISKIGKYLFQIGIVVFLIYQLTDIGWREVLNSLPTHPVFYLLFLLIFFALPITEIFTYNLSWDLKFWEGIPIFLKKRVYNKSIIEYSGELKLFAWARQKLNASNKEVFRVIRDNNIMSSVASTVVAFGLLLAFVLGDQIALMEYLQESGNVITAIAASAFTVILLGVAYRYRKYFFSMSKRVALSVCGLHILRLLILNTAQVLQWYVVLPQYPLRIWFTYLSLKIILSRIPFLPNKDLIFISAGLGVSELLNVTPAGLAGLLVTQGVLEKVMNVVLFIVISLQDKRKGGFSKSLGPGEKAD